MKPFSSFDFAMSITRVASRSFGFTKLIARESLMATWCSKLSMSAMIVVQWMRRGDCDRVRGTAVEVQVRGARLTRTPAEPH